MFPELTRDDVFRLETRRLWLRWPRQADVTAIARLAGDKAVAEMTAMIPHPYPAGEAERFVFAARQANQEGRVVELAIAPVSKPGTLIGMVRIGPGLKDGRPALGYWIGAPYWGKGYATEAARAMVDAFFAYTPHPELFADARVINPASRRVLEKCGFVCCGAGLSALKNRGGVFPTDSFRLDRRMWQSLKSWRASGYNPRPGPDEECDRVALS